jgi:hypothetical protein
MDIITRRSAVLSTTLHAGLVALAFLPRGCSTTPPPPPAAPLSAPAVPATPTAGPATAPTPASPASRLVLAPLTVPAPPLAAAGARPPAPTPDLTPLITPANSERPGERTGAGALGSHDSPVKPPALPARAGDLVDQLRAHVTSNLALSREEKLLRTTQEFLEDLLNLQLRGRWRAFSARVREPRLIIEVCLDAGGQVQAHLVNSSGDQELDLAIDAWLRSPDLRLPPIKPGIRYPFLVVIRR